MIPIQTLGAVIKATYEGQPDTNAFTDAMVAKVLAALPASARGSALGVAELDASGMIPPSRINVAGLAFQGAWNPVTNTPTLIDGTGTAGHFYKADRAGTYNFGNGTYVFNQGDWAIFVGGTWQRIGVSDAVGSVNGRLGDVVLTAADVGALPSTYTPPAAKVQSVNGQEGAVVLDAAAVGAKPAGYTPAWADVSDKPNFAALYQPKQRGGIGPAIPAGMYYRTSSQVIPQNTETPLNWTTNVYDPYGIRNGSNFTVPAWARYARLSGTVQWGGASGSSTNPIWSQVRVNGLEVPGCIRQRAQGSIFVIAIPISTTIFPVQPGDVISVVVSQSTVANRGVESGTCLQVEFFEAMS